MIFFFITFFRYFIDLFYSFNSLFFPFPKGCRLEKGHIVPFCVPIHKKKPELISNKLNVVVLIIIQGSLFCSTKTPFCVPIHKKKTRTGLKKKKKTERRRLDYH